MLKRFLVSETDARAATEAIFLSMGLPVPDARLATDVLITSDLRGCESHGVSNMLRNYSGNYLPGHVFPEGDHRARWSAENLKFILEKVEEIGELVSPPYQHMPQVATKFTIANPGVSTVILGARNPDQVIRNMDTERLPSLAGETIDLLKQKYGEITEYCNTQ